METIIGKRFGRLVVIEFSHRTPKHSYWRCKCDCGETVVTRNSRLTSGSTRSCGCLAAEIARKRAYKHGHYANGNNNGCFLRRVWNNMMARCFNPKSPGFRNYGGRGISVCDRWRDYETFVLDVGSPPGHGYSLGRKNNNGNYEPSNCRWETAEQQANNTRSNRIVTVDGKTGTVTQLARQFGFEPARIISRLHYGWGIELAFRTPLNEKISSKIRMSWSRRRGGLAKRAAVEE